MNLNLMAQKECRR